MLGLARCSSRYKNGYESCKYTNNDGSINSAMVGINSERTDAVQMLQVDSWLKLQHPLSIYRALVATFSDNEFIKYSLNFESIEHKMEWQGS